jgi:hypothetical protein
MKQGFQIETPASLSEVESMGTNESRESMGAMEPIEPMEWGLPPQWRTQTNSIGSIGSADSIAS